MRRTTHMTTATAYTVGLLLGASACGCAATPKTPGEKTPASYDAPLPDDWHAVWSPLGEPPLVEFRFPPPQDSYVGEIHRVNGHLRFGEGLAFDRARGNFSVHVHAVEMGEPDLTLNVQNAIDMLHARRHPKISYEIRSVKSDTEKLTFGVRTPVVLRGLFRLKGITFPLNVAAIVQPTLDETEQPIMMLTGTFALTDIKNRFDISGPGDPEDESSSTVILNFRFRLLPKERADAIRAKELSERKPYSEPDEN